MQPAKGDRSRAPGRTESIASRTPLPGYWLLGWESQTTWLGMTLLAAKLVAVRIEDPRQARRKIAVCAVGHLLPGRAERYKIAAGSDCDVLVGGIDGVCLLRKIAHEQCSQ